MRLGHDGPTEFASSLITKIQARTHGQVRELRVEVKDEQVVLQGRTRTHYAKQLAQHGAMDYVRGQRVVNQIVVG